MLKIIVSVITFVSLCLLLLLLNITTPATAGPFGILAIFILAYMSSFGLVAFFLYFISRIFSYLSKIFMTVKPFKTLTFKRTCLFSSVIAAAPIMLVGLRSVGEMGFYEYLLVLFFTVIGCLYISKRTY
jgi:hypothetical protein